MASDTDRIIHAIEKASEKTEKAMDSVWKKLDIPTFRKFRIVHSPHFSSQTALCASIASCVIT